MLNSFLIQQAQTTVSCDELVADFLERSSKKIKNYKSHLLLLRELSLYSSSKLDNSTNILLALIDTIEGCQGEEADCKKIVRTSYACMMNIMENNVIPQNFENEIIAQLRRDSDRPGAFTTTKSLALRLEVICSGKFGRLENIISDLINRVSHLRFPVKQKRGLLSSFQHSDKEFEVGLLEWDAVFSALRRALCYDNRNQGLLSETALQMYSRCEKGFVDNLFQACCCTSAVSNAADVAGLASVNGLMPLTRHAFAIVQALILVPLPLSSSGYSLSSTPNKEKPQTEMCLPISTRFLDKLPDFTSPSAQLDADCLQSVCDIILSMGLCYFVERVQQSREDVPISMDCYLPGGLSTSTLCVGEPVHPILCLDTLVAHKNTQSNLISRSILTTYYIAILPLVSHSK